jgi:hypothetical protein
MVIAISLLCENMSMDAIGISIRESAGVLQAGN